MSYQIETWIGQAFIVGGLTLAIVPLAWVLLRDGIRRWRHGDQ